MTPTPAPDALAAADARVVETRDAESSAWWAAERGRQRRAKPTDQAELDAAWRAASEAHGEACRAWTAALGAR